MGENTSCRTEVQSTFQGLYTQFFKKLYFLKMLYKEFSETNQGHIIEKSYLKYFSGNSRRQSMSYGRQKDTVLP